MVIPEPVLIAAGLILLVLALGAVSRPGSPKRDLMHPPTPPPAMSAPLVSEVRVLLERREKIAAIRLVREELGIGLKEAKDAVEALERGSLQGVRRR